MIQFDDVTLEFGGTPLFTNASFTLQRGERCGLVGKNGSGKSTLFRLINRELENDKGLISIPKNYRIGYLQQHLQFTQPTLLEEAALGLPVHERDHLYKAEKILFGLGFTAANLDVSPQQFSGGYQIRLHLAKVLISEPNCLLLDEPTNYLDILSIRWLSQFLSRWSGEFILITHDRSFMDSVTTHTMGIHRQKLRKVTGSSLEFFQQIVLEEEVYEKTRAKSDKRRAHLQNYIERFGAKATKAAQAQSKKKMLEREPVLERLNQISELSFHFQEAPFPGKKLLHAKDLHFSYTQNPLIENVSIEIEKGERIAIIGKNGRGKSTLLRLLCGDLKPQKGEIEASVNARIGYFGQTHVERLKENHTIQEEISLANPNLNQTQVKGIAGLMMFSGSLAEKKIAVLSGGEKSRVLLGKIVAKQCNFLLLDEPTHHLDIETVEALIDALEEFTGALVIVTHSELILRRLSLDKIILCKESSQSLFLGNYDEFLEKMGWEEEKPEKTEKGGSVNVRKDRAEWVAKRAAVLKPIEKKMKDIENKIAVLEEAQKKDQASLEQQGVAPNLLKALGLRQKELDQFEAELLALYENYEIRKKEFDEVNS